MEPRVVEGRRLDWHGRYPESNLPFMIDQMDCYRQHVPHPGQKTWTRTKWLNQRQIPGCTGWAAGHVMSCTPRVHDDVDDETCLTWYHENQKNDQWEGEDYEGSSVWGAMVTLKKAGRVREYRWCRSIEDLVHAVEWHGPMEWGTGWFSGMFWPDSNNFIHATGVEEGGHAYCVGAVDYDERFFVVYQSWEESWGDHGSAKISFDDVEKLMSNWGEFVVPLKAVPHV